MDNVRLFLIASLVFVLFMLWQAWEKDYGSQARQFSADVPLTSAPAADPALATGAAPADMPVVTPGAAPASDPQVATPVIAEHFVTGGRIAIKTDLIEAEIDLAGGDIRILELRQYPEKIDDPDKYLRLMNDSLPNIFVAQGGLLSKDGAPDHHAQYASPQTRYVLAEDDDQLSVRLFWISNDGLEVTKEFVFARGRYAITVNYHINNASEQAWTGRQYAQFQRTLVEEGSRFLYTYLGAAISSPDDLYEKITFDDMEDGNLEREITGGWAAMIQHYFVGAWAPDPDKPYHYYTKVLDGPRYAIGLYSSPLTVAPGGQASIGMTLYAGPKLQDQLEAVAPGLELTVDYGWLWFIAQPLFWLLTWLYSVFGNWGWAIIFVTIAIKAAFFRLSAASYKSMANMRRVQPRMVAIKERYGSDRARLNKAMMDLYKTEKINPLGGCLPILVQIPVFISLYWVLLESVELRQSPFIFWINDLSAMDPYYVLPVLMGASMLIQQRLNPAPMDPVQAKVMAMLPIVFTVFFAFFPAGLVLYWVVNNILSIAQQWYITSKVVPKTAPAN